MEDLFFTDKGNSNIPVILIHGFCESHRIWDNLSQKLSETHRVLCPDLPGFGDSNFPESKEFSIEDIAAILDSWLFSLGIEKCVMIGHSLGGYVTLAYVDRYKEKIQGFGLFHSTSYADSAEKKNVRNKVVKYIDTHGANEFTDTFIPGLFYHRSKEVDEDIAQLTEEARKCTAKSLISYTLAMKERTDLSKLMKGDIPVLFIAGEKDGAVPIESSYSQSKSLDPEYVHFIPDTGHMGMFERKPETTRMVSDFLKQFKL
jgi:pimeloyl-ACP methyl ester carboxylesterase